LEQHVVTEHLVYADGRRQGAPSAVQITDRFHLVSNLSEAVERDIQQLQIDARKQLAQSETRETSKDKETDFDRRAAPAMPASTLKIDPRLTGAHLSMGRALLAQGGMAQNTSTAENEFQAELAVDRGNANALFELGQIVYRRGNEETAEAFFSKSVERRPSFSDAHMALAKISSDHNRNAEAIEHLQTALKSAPNNQTAHYRLAQLYRNLEIQRRRPKSSRLLVDWPS